MIIATMRHEIDMLSTHRASYKAVETENAQLKSKIELLQSIESVLTASQHEVDDVLKQNLSARDLSVMVGTLRRELNSNEIRKNEIRKQLQSVRNDLRADMEERKQIQDKLSFYESENHTLRSRLARLEKSETEDSMLDSTDVEEDSQESAKRPRLALKHLGDQNTPSPLNSSEFKRRVTKIQESESPYLKVKASSIALSSLLRKPITMKEAHASGSSKAKTPSDESNKLSIFQKPRITNTAAQHGLVYNGIGGTTKILQSDLRKTHSMDSFWPAAAGSKTTSKSLVKKKLSPTAMQK